ncbi:hypothetical protein G6O69_16030 [Pseudenhygromyxa sp. WMMC2535]|uniref:peroxiredoxin family protein n=1 Tax=Pseudenhygromyxa sp. WMMC2535 TaxID=2712867 RepID=UPI001595CD3C|nr:hypothetical protein [Pseudenhygromyxa sp. WMMC2535]NVB39352.1 hypothetical protein [Pseudenhygromyxa sp. WMMC2535]
MHASELSMLAPIAAPAPSAPARKWGRIAPLAASVLLLACPKQASEPTAEPAEPPPAEPAAPIVPEEPAKFSAGETLEATIPLVGGESLELASLRGRPVLLEISASWEPGWDAAHTLYAELLAEHEQLAVIVIAAQPEDQDMLELDPGIHAGWDPAGALAAKFSVAIFPTMFVLAPDGQILAVLNGWDEGVRARLREAVAAAAGG